MTNPTSPDVPDRVAHVLDAHLYGDDRTEQQKRALGRAVDYWAQEKVGSLLARVLTVECPRCKGNGWLGWMEAPGGAPAGVSKVDCHVCHGRGRVLSDEVVAACARRAGGDAELQAEYEALVWELING